MSETESTPPAKDASARRGRPAKLTPERHERFVQLARASNAFATCAQAVGVTEQQARRWYAMGSGEGAKEPYVSFRHEVDVAEAEAEARNVAIVASAARDSWQAAAWLLERQHPERWARISQRREAQELTQPDKPSDPFAEIDEIAEFKRRRYGTE